MEELTVNRMLLAIIKKRTNTFSMIVQRKPRYYVEVFAMTVKVGIRERTQTGK